MVNVAAINRTLEAIKKAAPNRVKMEVWFECDKPICDTAGCIAGWVTMTHFKDHPAWAGSTVRENYDIRGDNMPADLLAPDMVLNATEVLGITKDQAEKLFLIKRREDDFSMVLEKYGIRELNGYSVRNQLPISYFDSLDAKVRQAAVISVLEHLRDTGEVNWPLAMEQALLQCGYQPVE